MKGRNNEKGFTLIELMIVVAIIGILAAIALPRFAAMMEKARVGQTKGNVGAIRSAMSIYYGDNQGTWPTTLSVGTAFYFSAYLDEIKPVAAKQIETGVQSGPGATSGGVVVTSTDPTSAVPGAVGYGWWYNNAIGGMYPNHNGSDINKFPFTCY